MPETDNLRRFIEIGISLTTTGSKTKLLDRLVDSAMEISRCDAGTLYLFSEGELKFQIMKTLSQGVNKGSEGESIDLPPVPLREENVCSYAAIHRELINIPDVYASDRFDFSGPKKYDAITGYKTVSMLVIPLADAEDVLIGVLQLINAMSDKGEVVPFTAEDEFTLRSIGSMAAVSLSGMIYLEEVKEQMHSFVSAFAAAVDERTPYNGSHTRRVAAYAGLMAEELNRRFLSGESGEYFDENRREQLVLAAALHDIGKMIIPLKVMNKRTRLDGEIEKIRTRFELLGAWYTIDALRGRITEEEKTEAHRRLKEGLELVERADSAAFLTDEAAEEICALASLSYIREDGTEVPYITDGEKTLLTIRKGTLSEDERKIMESHVLMTVKILSRVHFNSRYSNVIRFAGSHHELLDGSGYPQRLSGEQLETETRILTIADIYEALTNEDRPYKKAMSREKTFEIMEEMAEEGKLDGVLLKWFRAAIESIGDADVEKLAEQSGKAF